MDAQTVGKKITMFRQLRNMTQQQLSDKLFVSNKTISKWESGKGLPDVAVLPALASALGVSVDEIVTVEDSIKDDSFPAKRKILIKEKVKKGIFVTAVAIVLALVAANLLWTNYISDTFDPFIKNDNILAISEWNYDKHSSSAGRVTHMYRDYNGSGYLYQFGFPRRLEFGGFISIDRLVEQNGVDIRLMIFVKPGEWRYVLGLGVSEASTTHSFGSLVDENGVPQSKHPDDNVDDYERWLSLYEENYDIIIKLFVDMKEYFGDNAFRPGATTYGGR